MVRLVSRQNSCSQTQPVDGELENVWTHFYPIIWSLFLQAPWHMMLSMQLSSVSFSSSCAFLEILLKHAAMDAHKFWLPLQMYFLSIWRFQSSFPQNVATLIFPQKNPLHWIFLLASQCGKFRQKELNRNTAQESRGVFVFFFFLAQFCDVAKVVNIQKIVF